MLFALVTYRKIGEKEMTLNKMLPITCVLLTLIVSPAFGEEPQEDRRPHDILREYESAFDSRQREVDELAKMVVSNRALLNYTVRRLVKSTDLTRQEIIETADGLMNFLVTTCKGDQPRRPYSELKTMPIEISNALGLDYSQPDSQERVSRIISVVSHLKDKSAQTLKKKDKVSTYRCKSSMDIEVIRVDPGGVTIRFGPEESFHGYR